MKNTETIITLMIICLIITGGLYVALVKLENAEAAIEVKQQEWDTIEANYKAEAQVLKAERQKVELELRFCKEINNILKEN